VTIGGYATGKLMKDPKVFGAANNTDYIKEFAKHGVIFKTKGNRGGIVGASGLLVGMSQLRDIKSLCLMGETPGHPLLIDAKAAEKVLGVIGKWVGIKIKMGELDKRAKELEKFRHNLEKMMKKMMNKQEGGDEEEESTEEELKYIG
jgi:uncharacterized protein (TIGR00162 family)